MWRSDAFLRRGLDRAVAAVAAAILPFDVLFPALLPPPAVPSPPHLCLARPFKYACNGVECALSLLTSSYIGLPYILLPHLYARTFPELVYREHSGESARCAG